MPSKARFSLPNDVKSAGLAKSALGLPVYLTFLSKPTIAFPIIWKSYSSFTVNGLNP